MPDYVISVTTNRSTEPQTIERLVRAKNEAAAVKHVVKDTVQVDRASGDDYMRLAKLGIEIETAAE